VSIRRAALPRLTSEQLASLVPGSRVIDVPDAWFGKLEATPSVFNQLYVWLVQKGCVDGCDLHERARVGNKLQQRLLDAEQKRLAKTHRVSGDKLERALFWSDFGSGPRGDFAERKIVGNSICVLPAIKTEDEKRTESDLVSKNIALRANHAKKTRAKFEGEDFYHWLISSRTIDDHIGDVAREVFDDADFPKNALTYNEISQYVENWCDAAQSCLEEAWLEYITKYPDRSRIQVRCRYCQEDVDPSQGSILYLDTHEFTIAHNKCREADNISNEIALTHVCDEGVVTFRQFVEKCYVHTDPDVLAENRRFYSVDGEFEKKLVLCGLLNPRQKSTTVERSKNEGSTIYFVQHGETGAIKIGYTTLMIEKRIASLQTAASAPLKLLATLSGDRTTERDLHQRFAVHRRSGEWFDPHPDIIAFVSILTREVSQ
jgi:uncharacterized protein YozE (UPF0346 family)